MTVITATPTTLDRLFAPFESRAVTLTREEIAQRQRSLAVGADLSRLQGGYTNTAAVRMRNLYAFGQITQPEYFQLLATLAQHNYHLPDTASVHGR